MLEKEKRPTGSPGERCLGGTVDGASCLKIPISSLLNTFEAIVAVSCFPSLPALKDWWGVFLLPSQAIGKFDTER